MPAIDTTADPVNDSTGVVIVMTNTVSPAPPGTAEPTREKPDTTPPEAPQPRIRVWDGVVRSFHWLLVAGMLFMLVSAHIGRQEVHMIVGWAIVGLLLIRLVWGFIGTPYARFANFAVSPFESLRYLSDVARGHPRHYVGHNPAGAAMVFALLGMVALLSFSGLVLQATVEYEGPFAAALTNVSDHYAHEAFVLHKIATYGLYLMVPLHILGVVLASRQHQENLVLAMITGDKPASPQTATDNSSNSRAVSSPASPFFRAE